MYVHAAYTLSYAPRYFLNGTVCIRELINGTTLPTHLSDTGITGEARPEGMNNRALFSMPTYLPTVLTLTNT